MSRQYVPLAITAADIEILGWYCKTFHFNKGYIYRYTSGGSLIQWAVTQEALTIHSTDSYMVLFLCLLLCSLFSLDLSLYRKFF